VLAHRPGTLSDDAPIHPAAGFDETAFEVTGLSRDETGQLIEQVVGRRPVPAAFADAMYERTGGTALFVETTVQTLLETDQLDPQRQWYPTDPDEFDLLETLEWLVERCRQQGDDATVREWYQTAERLREAAPDPAIENHGRWIERHADGDGSVRAG